MWKTNLRKINLSEFKSFAVYSDTHLNQPHDHRTQAFLESLSGLPKVEAIFLAGDIFDFIYAKSPYFYDYWYKVFEALRAKRLKDNTKIYMIEGNHDFGFEHGTHDIYSSVFEAFGDTRIHTSHPKLGKIEITHGDHIICPPSYHPFRNTIKSKLFQLVAGIVPGKIMNEIFTRYTRMARDPKSWKRLEKTFLKNCLSEYLKDTDIDTFILGHIHVHLDTTIEGKRVLCGPGWFDSSSVLIVDARGKILRDWGSGGPGEHTESYLYE